MPYHHAKPHPVRVATLLVGLCLLAPSAAAGRSFDPNYAYRPSGQRDPVPRSIRRLVSPTLVFPALARGGETFTAVVRLTAGPDGKPLSTSDAAGWRVFLIADRHAQRCRVTDVKLERGKAGFLARLAIEVPVAMARDLYDLRVVALGLDDRQANAVRVLGPRGAAGPPAASRPGAASRPAQAGPGFTFAVVTDHQLWDPAYKLLGKQRNAGAYPGATNVSNLGMARQGLAELALHDPDFVLHTGDLVFGLHYTKEYAEARSLLRAGRLPIFAVPGNHDAYAIYTVRLHRRPLKLITGAVTCRKLLGGAMSWNKAWRFLSCVYGDVKDLLFVDLHRDGLTYWERQLGPPSYAFDHEGFRFIGINTYGGSAERRHAFSIYVDAFDLHLGAPAVDNYGGYLTEAALRWVDGQARDAITRGLTPVFFGHHDPRGNAEGRRYHPNESFPTDPVSSAGFEEWNYDSKGWDSNPRDGRRGETPARNSGVALLRILARSGGYYLSGHLHCDGRTVYAPGSRLGEGLTTERPLQFIRTTTASSSVKGDSYWGYRLIRARGGKLTAVDHAPEQGLASVPAGNLWVTRVDASPPKGKAKPPAKDPRDLALARQVALNTGLSRPTEAVLRWPLEARPEGYRFRLRPAPGSVARIDPRQRPRVEEVAVRGERLVYRIRVALPAADQPPTARNLLRYRLRALVARDNQPPRGRIGRVGEWSEGPLARPAAAPGRRTLRGRQRLQVAVRHRPRSPSLRPPGRRTLRGRQRLQVAVRHRPRSPCGSMSTSRCSSAPRARRIHKGTGSSPTSGASERSRRVAGVGPTASPPPVPTRWS